MQTNRESRAQDLTGTGICDTIESIDKRPRTGSERWKKEVHSPMKSRKLRAALCALVCLLLLSLLSGCGAGALIQGQWTDSSGSLSMTLGKDGKGIVTAYQIPLEITYTYENDVLTIIYSENITDSGTVTFYGDDEFVWEKVDKNGDPYTEDYLRQS